MLRRRLADLLAESAFLEVQLMALRESGPAHFTRRLGLRLAQLHRRLDAIERQLRLMARRITDEHDISLKEVRRRLSARTDRRQQSDLVYIGPDRRMGARRAADVSV